MVRSERVRHLRRRRYRPVVVVQLHRLAAYVLTAVVPGLRREWPAVSAKPARVTLNLPPELYRQLQQWANDAAVALDAKPDRGAFGVDVPRVGVQDTMRAMIRALTRETPLDMPRVLAELRGEMTRPGSTTD